MRNPDEEVAPLLARAVAAAGRGAWDEALQLVDRAIEEAPGRAEPLLTRARLLRASGRDPASALRALRRAIRCVQEPSRRAEVLAEYARALEPIGRYREAAAAFEEAITHLASQPDGGGTRRLELLDLAARAHERAGHLERALERHRAARPLYRDVRGDLGSYHAREAELLERLGRYDELCACYERLVEIDPDRVLFAQPAGRPSLETATRLKKLLVGINQVLARQPGALVPSVLKAGLFYRLGRYRQAAQLLRRTIRSGREHWFAWHLLGKVELKRGRRQPAREALLRARATAPDYLDLLRDTALVLELCGDLEAAERVYREIEASWPGEPDTLRRAAAVRERLGRLEEAYETWRLVALQQLGPDPVLRRRLAELAHRIGRPDRAEQHLGELLGQLGAEETERRLEALLQRAEVRAVQPGGEHAALEDIAEVVEGARALPAGVARRFLLEAASRLLESLERPEDALELLDAWLAEAPDDVDALLLRGDALFKAKRFEDSVACYTRAADRRLADALFEQGRELFDAHRFDQAIGKWNEAFSKHPRAWEIHYCAAAAYARLGQPEPAARFLEAAARQNPGALVLMEHDANFVPVRDSEAFAALERRFADRLASPEAAGTEAEPADEAEASEGETGARRAGGLTLALCWLALWLGLAGLVAPGARAATAGEERAAALIEQLERDGSEQARRALVQLGPAALAPLARALERTDAPRVWQRLAEVFELGVRGVLQELDAALEQAPEPGEAGAQQAAVQQAVRRVESVVQAVGYAAARELARPVALRRRTAVLAREALLDDLFTRLRKEYARLEGEGPEALASLEKRLVRLGSLVAPLLARWLESERPGRAFAERVRDRICARCVGWLGSTQEFEREFGAQSLYAMGPLAQPVLERLRRGDDPDLQERAAVLLRRIRWRISDPLYLRLGHLLPGFETASWRQRRYEVYRLEKQGGAEAVGTLREILARDPSRGVRLMAAESLARLGDVYGFEYLARAGLEPLLQSPEVKAQIAMDQGIRYLQIGRYERAIAEFETVLEIEPGNFIALYNLACAYALGGDAERACTYLERAVQAGFDDLEHIESDPDLDAIREHPRYRKVIEALRRAGTSKENESR